MARTPLATPIALGRTATHWALIEANFDFDLERVALTVELADVDGAVIQTTRISDTFAALGITQGEATSLRARITTRLKNRGLIT